MLRCRLMKLKNLCTNTAEIEQLESFLFRLGFIDILAQNLFDISFLGAFYS